MASRYRLRRSGSARQQPPEREEPPDLEKEDLDMEACLSLSGDTPAIAEAEDPPEPPPALPPPPPPPTDLVAHPFPVGAFPQPCEGNAWRLVVLDAKTTTIPRVGGAGSVPVLVFRCPLGNHEHVVPLHRSRRVRCPPGRWQLVSYGDAPLALDLPIHAPMCGLRGRIEDGTLTIEED